MKRCSRDDPLILVQVLSVDRRIIYGLRLPHQPGTETGQTSGSHRINDRAREVDGAPGHFRVPKAANTLQRLGIEKMLTNSHYSTTRESNQVRTREI